ncbi:MAG: hypothetical protein WC208_03085 [Gallionella sp.]|jgi:hypothetical protein
MAIKRQEYTVAARLDSCITLSGKKGTLSQFRTIIDGLLHLPGFSYAGVRLMTA